MGKNGVDGVYLVDFNIDFMVMKFDIVIYFEVL